MKTISVKELRLRLPEVMSQVKQGGRFTVLHRSRPAFEIVPPGAVAVREGPPDGDSLYQAGPTGSSADGKAAREHDRALYR